MKKLYEIQQILMNKKKEIHELAVDCIITTIISFVSVFLLLGRFDFLKSLLYSIVFVFVASILPHLIHRNKRNS